MSIKRPNFAGQVLHTMNRRVDRKTLFYTNDHYIDFRSLLAVAQKKFNLRILEWVLMPNHWHMLLWPETKDQVGEFMQWLNACHARLFRQMTDTTGNGAVYQSRYKAFPVRPGRHIDRLRNYLAMNPVRARLVQRSTDWRWGSARRAENPDRASRIILTKGPEPHCDNLKQILTHTLKFDEYQAKLLRKSLANGRPYGDEDWIHNFIEKHNSYHLYGKKGRPKNSLVENFE